MISSPIPSPAASPLLAQQALGRAAGAPLLEGNSATLLIDAPAHFEAWLAAIRGARERVLLENYIVRDDAVGHAFRAALIDRAKAGVVVVVIVDWLGCIGQSGDAFWKPLREVGGQIRVFNPLQWGRPFGWLSRDHRKLLVVDGRDAFLSGVCLSAKWLGDAKRGVPPWRDTGVAISGPAVADLEAAFAQSWASIGTPLAAFEPPSNVEQTGSVAMRVIATQPSSAGIYRLDQMIAAMAHETLWLTDAYFVGVAPYVQALIAASRDGVDVRLLVPSTSDIPMVAAMSRAGYRPLLKAGIRVFEWNGSMLHAKTAVADGRWARVGSSNLNLASWLNNREIDVAIEDEEFAEQLTAQYEKDLQNATEIVLEPRRFRRGEKVRRAEPRPPHRRRVGGSSSRAATGALRIANTVGAALIDRRVLGDTESTPLLIAILASICVAVIGILWPAVLAWPIALVSAWFALNFVVSAWRLYRDRPHTRRAGETADPD